MNYCLIALILFMLGFFLFIWNVRRQTFDIKAEINTDIKLNKFVYVDEETKMKAHKLKTQEICFVNPEDHGDMVCLTPTDIKVLKNMEKPSDFENNYPFNANRLARSICIGEECINKAQLKNMTRFWPKGAVFAYSGKIASIPEGWMVCNGENGTIDLRDKFIRGKKDDETLGNISGQNEIYLSMNNMPSHHHRFNMNNGGDGLTGDSKGLFWGQIHESKRKNKNDTNRSETYQIKNPKDLTNKFGITQNEIGGDVHSNLPPFYKLLYIQKIV